MEDFTAEMIKDMAFRSVLSAVRQSYQTIKVQTTEVLFTGMPVTVEQHSSETGELEDRAVEDLPGVRQGIFLPTTVWTRTEILQPRLCESRKECIGWNL